MGLKFYEANHQLALIVDEIDELIGPIYRLTKEEIEYEKSYDAQ